MFAAKNILFLIKIAWHVHVDEKNKRTVAEEQRERKRQTDRQTMNNNKKSFQFRHEVRRASKILLFLAITVIISFHLKAILLLNKIPC